MTQQRRNLISLSLPLVWVPFIAISELCSLYATGNNSIGMRTAEQAWLIGSVLALFSPVLLFRAARRVWMDVPANSQLLIVLIVSTLASMVGCGYGLMSCSGHPPTLLRLIRARN